MDIKFLISVFLRRLPYFLIVVAIVTAAGISTAFLLPPEYRARSLLLVEREQIPGDLAESTVRTGPIEALQIIQQRLLARENLIELSHKLGLTPAGADPSDVAARMRDQITFAPRSGRDQAITLEIAFRGKTPEEVLRVTNELVARTLEMNVEMRTGLAAETLQFFKQEVQRLGAEQDQRGADLLKFRLEHQNDLPDSLDYRRTRQATLQERLGQLQRERDAKMDRRTRLVDLFERTGQIDPSNNNMTSAEKELAELQAELARSMLLYSEQNPKIRLLRTRIEGLKKLIADERASSTEADGQNDPELSLFEVQLRDIDGEIAYIDDQSKQVQAAIDELQESIDATPSLSVQLGEMERDYDIVRDQYDAAAQRLAQAQTGERIEVTAKGQRISVVEQAIMPKKPSGPNRGLIAFGSFLGGTALAGCFVMLLEITNRSIRRPAEINAKLGITPLATLPYIRTERETRMRRIAIVAVLALVVIGVSSGLYILHTYYMPIDSIFKTVMTAADPASPTKYF